mgnify:CR=1 FL=1
MISKNRAICFWVGDVKIFHIRDNKLQFESSSHNLINEVKNNGSITDSNRLRKYRHIVTRSVQGEIKDSQVETKIIGDLSEKDIFIISSDGVHDIINGLNLQSYLNSSGTLIQATKRIEERLKKEATDNFSMIVIQYI